MDVLGSPASTWLLDLFLISPDCSNHSPQHMKRFSFTFPFITSRFYLFNVQEVLGIKGDGSAWDRDIFIQSSAVTHVSLNSKRYRFRLQTETPITNSGNFPESITDLCYQITENLIEDVCQIHQNPDLTTSHRPAEFSSLENTPVYMRIFTLYPPNTFSAGSSTYQSISEDSIMIINQQCESYHQAKEAAPKLGCY